MLEFVYIMQFLHDPINCVLYHELHLTFIEHSDEFGFTVDFIWSIFSFRRINREARETKYADVRVLLRRLRPEY